MFAISSTSISLLGIAAAKKKSQEGPVRRNLLAPVPRWAAASPRLRLRRRRMPVRRRTTTQSERWARERPLRKPAAPAAASAAACSPRASCRRRSQTCNLSQPFLPDPLFNPVHAALLLHAVMRCHSQAFNLCLCWLSRTIWLIASLSAYAAEPKHPPGCWRQGWQEAAAGCHPGRGV